MFQIKNRYKLQLQRLKHRNYLVAQIYKTKNGGKVPSLEVIEVVLV